MKELTWRWAKGPVDRSLEHIEIRYGSVNDGGWESWVPAALVGKPKDRTFPVELLLPEDDPLNGEIIKAVKKELNFYLVKLAERGEEDLWAYALYHCNTASNIYSNVHWSYFLKE